MSVAEAKRFHHCMWHVVFIYILNLSLSLGGDQGWHT